MPDTIELLERLVAFDSTSRKPNLDLIAWIESRLKAYGISSRRIPNGDASKASLVTRIGPAVEGGVVLCGHSDTVPVDGQRWATNPFQLVEKDARLYGRGTADMKGFIASVLAAVPKLAAAELLRPVLLAFTYDEELGCFGAPGVARDLVVNEPPPAAVITGEPTSLQIVRAHKGIRVLQTSVIGLEGHSSQAQPTANAVLGAARIVARIADLADELHEAGLRVDGFHPAHTTLSVGIIEGGHADNIVPGRCIFTWECRPVPDEDVDAILATIEGFARDEVLPYLRRTAPDADIVFEIIAEVAALDSALNADAASLVAGLSGAATGPAVSFGSDAAALQQAGLPTVLFGPGSMEQGHRPNEYIERAQLEQFDQFLTRLTTWAATAQV